MESDDRFDDNFAHILTELGSKDLPGLLDRFFGFLHRRTDFFQLSPGPEGFLAAVPETPKDLSEILVLKSFKNWQHISRDRAQRKHTVDKISQPHDIVAQEVEVETTQTDIQSKTNHQIVSGNW